MSIPTKTGLPSRKKFVTCLSLSLILIGSTISSIALFGFTISPQQVWASHLAAPTLTSPTNNAITGDNTPTLNWGAVSGAATYSIQIDNDAAFTAPILLTTGPSGPPTSTSFTPTGAQSLADGTYYWRVATKGTGTDALGTYGSPFSFTVDTSGPSAPNLVAPSDVAFTNDPTPFYDWDASTDVSGIERYTVEVATSSSFGGTLVAGAGANINAPTTQFDSTFTLSDGQYYWHVRARDNLGNNGPFSTTRTFTVDTAGPTVTASPTTGTFGPTLQVTLSSLNTDLAAIYYTTDGTTPDSGDTLYTAAIPITTTTTLKFIGYDTLGNAGPVGTETYTIDSTGPTVTALPTSTAFGPLGLDVELNSDDDDLASIFYTTDGSDPDTSATRTEYTAAIHLTTTTTLKFIGYDNFDNKGTPGEETYTLDTTGPTVTASPTTGTFGPAGTSVTLSSADASDSIFYTTDGSDPDTSATRTEYTGPISITTTTTLKFIGYDTFENPGPVGTETYTIETGTTTDTSMSLQLSGNSKATPGATFTASGKLIDAIADSPLSGKPITFTIDGTSAGGTVPTDNKGKFTVQLTAPTAIGNHDIQAHFGGDTEYNLSDSPIKTLKVEAVAPADTSLTLQLSKNKVNAGSSYSASGTLINEVTKKPIAGMTISVTTDGSSAQTGTTDSKGKFDTPMTAPNTNGDHDIQAHFAATSEYNPSNSPVKKLTVQGGTNLALTTTTSTDTSLTLKVEGKDKMIGSATYSVSGKLIDSVSKKPIADKEISITTDGASPKGSDTTNSKGEFEVNLKAPDSPGKYDIKAHFDGDSQYKSSDSSVKITVEETTLSSQKTTVTTNPPKTDEQQTDEQQTDEEQTDEEQTDEQPEEPEEQPEEQPEE